MSHLADLRAKKATILASSEWAYAMSSDPALRNHPTSRLLRERVKDIDCQIAELAPDHGEEIQ